VWGGRGHSFGFAQDRLWPQRGREKTLLKILSRITEPSEGKEKKGLQLLNRLEQ
jgi:hypothetical protein